MNSRERVLIALCHQEPDRVPIDLDGMASTGIMAVAYNRLKAHLGENILAMFEAAMEVGGYS